MGLISVYKNYIIHKSTAKTFKLNGFPSSMKTFHNAFCELATNVGVAEEISKTANLKT